MQSKWQVTVSIAVMITSPFSVGGLKCVCADGNAHLIYVHGQDVRMMNILTGTYTDLAKNRLTILSVDYNFKEGMVSASRFVYVILYCISCCFNSYLSGCPPI